MMLVYKRRWVWCGCLWRMDGREVEAGGGGQGGNAAICWAPVGWLSQYGEDWSGWIGGRLPDGLKVEVRGAGGEKEEA